MPDTPPGSTPQQQGSRFATGNPWVWVLAAVVVLAVIALTLAPRYIDDFSTTVWAYLIWAILIAGYFLPTIIAGRRKHHNLGAIIAVNLLLGWTLLGWLIALIWSLTAVHNPYSPQQAYPTVHQPPPPVQYQVGDIVNGHRFNGQTWQPLP